MCKQDLLTQNFPHLFQLPRFKVFLLFHFVWNYLSHEDVDEYFVRFPRHAHEGCETPFHSNEFSLVNFCMNCMQVILSFR